MDKDKVKVVILCGGLGSRLSEETKLKPKPMVKIGGIPILLHIMNIYSKYGYKNFILALGYKKNYIKKFFRNFKNKNKWNIELVDTGKDSLTARRILLLKKYLIKNDFFFLTYGDGVSNINLDKLIQSHLISKKTATVTAVRPPARFGELKFNGNLVSNFDEKNQINSGWINGGFFVFGKNIFNYLPNSNTMLERQTMNKLTESKQLNAFKHQGFWQCMDTLRDKEVLNNIWKKKLKW